MALIVMEELADDKESVKAQTQKIVEEMKACVVPKFTIMFAPRPPLPCPASLTQPLPIVCHRC